MLPADEWSTVAPARVPRRSLERVPLCAGFITDGKLRTLPVGLASFITGDVYGWGYLMSGAVLTTLPVIAAYIYLQKYMVEGLTAGSVKG